MAVPLLIAACLIMNEGVGKRQINGPLIRRKSTAAVPSVVASLAYHSYIS
jgi:hypothetical protein